MRLGTQNGERELTRTRSEIQPKLRIVHMLENTLVQPRCVNCKCALFSDIKEPRESKRTMYCAGPIGDERWSI
jgi:hypothetical protein